jgi:predicted MPP superfamily phosphohydrolase
MILLILINFLTRIGFIALLVMSTFQGYKLNVTNYDVNLSSHSGTATILQISDFHNRGYVFDNGSFFDVVDAYAFDYVFFTGDIVDERTKDFTQVEELFAHYADYECFYVTGNHEFAMSEDKRLAFFSLLNEYNVIRLGQNNYYPLSRLSSTYVIGVDDPYQYAGLDITREENDELYFTDLEQEINNLPPEAATILLAHRPEYFKEYANYGVDVIFSGHTHGGQINFPGRNDLINMVSSRPFYSGGIFYEQSSTMINSRGIGYSTLKIRFGSGTSAEVTLTKIRGV